MLGILITPLKWRLNFNFTLTEGDLSIGPITLLYTTDYDE